MSLLFLQWIKSVGKQNCLVSCLSTFCLNAFKSVSKPALWRFFWAAQYKTQGHFLNPVNSCDRGCGPPHPPSHNFFFWHLVELKIVLTIVWYNLRTGRLKVLPYCFNSDTLVENSHKSGVLPLDVLLLLQAIPGALPVIEWLTSI